MGVAVVDPESVTAYEVGAKTTLLDNRLRLNISAFHYDYEDMQVLAFDSVAAMTVLNNAAESSIQGIEVSATALLSESFQLDVGLSWLDAEYEEFLTFDDSSPNSFINLEGNKLPLSPEFTASIGLGYNHEISDVGELQARLDYYYSAEKFFNELNNEARQESYDLVNARIGLKTQDGAWDITVFGSNLTDELVSTLEIVVPFFYGDSVNTQLAPPRTYGVSVAYNF